MRPLAILVVVSLVLAAVLGGAAPFGRVLLTLGLPDLAARTFVDPAWRGIAAYRDENYEAAAADFAKTKSVFNQGNAQARLGDYAAALEAFDIAQAQGDQQARANFELVAAYYAGLGIDPEALGLFPERKDGPTADSFIARGDAVAAGTGSEVTNNNTMLGLVELDSRGRLGVRQIFDDKFIVADERWLTQLTDVPGDFLTARIAYEYKRRTKLGLSPPAPEDPK